jgi:DNA modification methylase
MSARNGHAIVLRGDARDLPLPDDSVDLIVTSPPYWAQRSYQDGGQHYDGQIGDESSPGAYIDSLLDCVTEWTRVLKPTGSLWVNLGDKYASNPRGPNGSSSALTNGAQQRPGRSGVSASAAGVPRKSLLLLPERFRIACVDKIGLIARETVVWNKTNGMPESATDRCRRSHEDWVHLTKAERYYSAVDYLRTPPSGYARRPGAKRVPAPGQRQRTMSDSCNPLGALPGSVWSLPTQPLIVPPHVAHEACCGGAPVPGCQQGLRHFAAFPTALPRTIINGWCPRVVCLACGEGRRPAVDTGPARGDHNGDSRNLIEGRISNGHERNRLYRERRATATGIGIGIGRRIVGETCACLDVAAPTRPGVVLDPFGGTGTTALVASALGRVGITVDRSADYCRLAQWRTSDSRQIAKAMGQKPPAVQHRKDPGQLDIFDAAEA